MTTLEEKEVLREKSRKKIQALLNFGFVIFSQDKEYTKSNEIARLLEDGAGCTLTISSAECMCIEVSEMVFKLLKPFIKDLLHIEQKTSKKHFLFFKKNAELEEIFIEENEDFQLLERFELGFNKYTLPSYKNTARLYTVNTPPILTPKQINKVKEIYQTVIQNKDSYFLLSNSISHSYNMPMTILRKLGENVIPLKTLDLLELTLGFGTNSSCLFRDKNGDKKSFAIPLSFFNHEDFELNQTEEEIKANLNILQSLGLINRYDYIDEVFYIFSNLIESSIKQYSYKQNLHYYSSMNLKKKDYVYTSINYLQYIKNYYKKEVIKTSSGEEIEREETIQKLTISLEGLLYNLELDKYIHDHTYLADVLKDLINIGVNRELLIPTSKEINKDTIKYLLSHRDRLHEHIVLNPHNPTAQNPCSTTTHFNNMGRPALKSR